MAKIASHNDLSLSTTSTPEDPQHWNRHPAEEFPFYALACHEAAKLLAGALECDSGAFIQFNSCPMVVMYRHAVEYYLKALVLGPGASFLTTRPDPVSICKTHSLAWLSQFVCQIVTAIGWAREFKCDGISNLVEFRATIEQLNHVHSYTESIRFPAHARGRNSDLIARTFNVHEFAHRMDALLSLLSRTVEALARGVYMRSEVIPMEPDWHDGNDIEPTIQ